MDDLNWRTAGISQGFLPIELRGRHSRRFGPMCRQSAFDITERRRVFWYQVRIGSLVFGFDAPPGDAGTDTDADAAWSALMSKAQKAGALPRK
jgi:hypothetical protein